MHAQVNYLFRWCQGKFFTSCNILNVGTQRTVESLILTPKGQSEVSVLERCPYKRAHNDDVTFMTPLIVLSVQELKPGLHSSLN